MWGEGRGWSRGQAQPEAQTRHPPWAGGALSVQPSPPGPGRRAGRRWGDRARPPLLAALLCSLPPHGVLGEVPAMWPAGGRRPWEGGPGRDRRCFSARRWPAAVGRLPSNRPSFSSTLGFSLPTPASPGGCPPLPRTAPDVQPVWSPASLHPTSGHPLWASPFCADPQPCPSTPHPLLQACGPVDNLPAQGRPWRGCVSVCWTGAHPAPPPGAVSLLRRRPGVVLPSTGQWTRELSATVTHCPAPALQPSHSQDSPALIPELG